MDGERAETAESERGTAAIDREYGATDSGKATANRNAAEAGVERVARATAGDATRRTEAVKGIPGATGLDVPVAEIEASYPESVADDVVAGQARLLSAGFDADGDGGSDRRDRAERVASTAREQASRDVPPSAFVSSHASVIERLVEGAFDAVEDGASVADAREALLAGLEATLIDLAVGADAFADRAAEDATAGLSGAPLSLDALFEAIPYPAFLVDDEHTVLAYNTGLNRLLGLEDDHRAFLGGDNRETIAAATYTDGRRHRSLVDKVAENPRDAAEHWDVERVDDEIEFTDHLVYEDRSVTKDERGRETHISFLAIPIFDADGGLTAVLELVEDRSEEIRHERAVSELIGEVTDTLDRIGDGDLSARASYEDDRDVVDPALLELTTDVNEMAADFEALVERVDARTRDLEASIERAADAAGRIDDQVAEQTDSLESVADEVSDFSATMEEVAASADDVVDAAEDAVDRASDGVERGESAREVTDDLIATSEDLVETVERLEAYMEEIDSVVELIDDVADQTNLLAINANIEAAKADETGAGFAVVANEVKSLAEETQSHTDEIAGHVERVRTQATETVSGVERTRERVEALDEEIADALASFRAISTRAEAAATGIEEVADANDEQAATVEEVASTIEELRTSSRTITETTDEIVAETETQEDAVAELAANVEALSTSDADGGGA